MNRPVRPLFPDLLPQISRRQVLAATGLLATVPSSIASGAPDIPRLTDFGGIGDGIADNFHALQRALTAIGPSGTLYVPPGNFKLLDDNAAAGRAAVDPDRRTKALGSAGAIDPDLFTAKTCCFLWAGGRGRRNPY
jgi:hypothetical protein